MFETAECDRLVALLRGSLAIWGIDGGVEAAGDVAVVRTAGGGIFSVTRAAGPDGAPGWRVASLGDVAPPGSGRFHPSIVGVLRDLHDSVDPARPVSRMVVAPLPADG